MPMTRAVEHIWRLMARTRPLAEEGQDLLEYALLAALVAVFALGAVATVGHTIYDLFWSRIGTAI